MPEQSLRRPSHTAVDNRAARRTTTFVIVTGAGGTPGGINELSLRGHRTVAVDLPGHGPADGQFDASYQAPQDLDTFATRPSPMAGIGLDSYVETAVAVVRRVAEYGPVVLYGGSMGGATISRVANEVPDLIDRLVYDSAFCCVDLASIQDYLLTPEASTSLLGSIAALSVGDPAALGAVRLNYRTADAQKLAPLKEALMASASDAEFFGSLASLQPDDSLTVGMEDARVRAESWGRVPRTYIRHTEDLGIPLALQDRMIAEADALTPANPFEVHSVAAGHAPTAREFEQIVDILDRLGTLARQEKG